MIASQPDHNHRATHVLQRTLDAFQHHRLVGPQEEFRQRPLLVGPDRLNRLFHRLRGQILLELDRPEDSLESYTKAMQAAAAFMQAMSVSPVQ